jgi:peroxiredoxin Q/BCP
MGVQVLGVSVQDVKSHAGFAAKYHLPFPILADSDQKTAAAYGVLKSYLGFHLAHRETFIVDPKGHIAKHYKDVDPRTHSGQVQADLAALQAAAATPAKTSS